MTRPFCAWCNKGVQEMHITNDSVTIGFCYTCSTEILHKIQYANFRKEHPHRFPEEERRIRPMPSPFEEPKLPEFEHGQENS